MTNTSVAGTPSPSSSSDDALVSVQGLSKRFVVKHDLIGRPNSWLSAVDDVTLTIRRGETFSIVGETGCGKSTLAQLIMRLESADSGRVEFDGHDVLAAGRAPLRALRRRMQLVFQDPFSSLDPRMNVGQIIAEGMQGLGLDRGQRRIRIQELMELVGLGQTFERRYPHELSGGQRQRVAIARALAVDPEFIILDEPVSALDVSIQSPVLNLLRDLQRDFNLTYLFITHDLAVVRHISDRVGVMYLGKLVEVATKDELFRRPLHPYTQALLSAIPNPQADSQHRAERIVLAGEAPSPIDPPSNCRFAGRCFRAIVRCREAEPPFEPARTPGDHLLACFNYTPLNPIQNRGSNHGE